MHLTGTDVFIAALLLGYVIARWRIHKWQQQRRR
jgi:hypothetical protein